MATTEHNGLMIYKDRNGDNHVLYPITKAELVDGLDPEAVGAAAAVHEHNANDITAGVLGLSRGGTGLSVSSLAELASALGAAKIAYGSYTGTGTAGSDNKNVLTFDFVPKLVVISAAKQINLNAGSTRVMNWAVLVNGVANAYVRMGASDANDDVLRITWGDKTLSFYHDRTNAYAASQLNTNGIVYNYVVLG